MHTYEYKDSSYYNFQVLKQLNREFMKNEVSIPKHIYTKRSSALNSNADESNNQNISIMNNKVNKQEKDFFFSFELL